MEEVVLYCPMCHGRVLAADTPLPGHPAQRLPGQQFYCPSCEMFVDAERGPASDETNPGAHPVDAPENDGRQRGDMSDQGATQWRKDPSETERNTWRDKP
jgi:hypothetical protein